MVEQLQGSGSTSKKRIEYIDAMRGFTMLLVVFGHVLTHGLNNYSEGSVVYSFFQTFRMPMFFFISGYEQLIDGFISQFVKFEGMTIALSTSAC